MNLDPINDRKFTTSDALVIGTSDKDTFKQRYFGRRMEGLVHFNSVNVGTHRQNVAFLKTENTTFSCKVKIGDVPTLVRWGNQPDLLMSGYMFYASSFRAGNSDIFLTGCQITRRG